MFAPVSEIVSLFSLSEAARGVAEDRAGRVTPLKPSICGFGEFPICWFRGVLSHVVHCYPVEIWEVAC